jgi:hypothetical protein
MVLTLAPSNSRGQKTRTSGALALSASKSRRSHVASVPMPTDQSRSFDSTPTEDSHKLSSEGISVAWLLPHKKWSSRVTMRNIEVSASDPESIL